MKRLISVILTVITLFMLISPLNAYAESPKEEIYAPDYIEISEDQEFSPYSSDNLNMILMVMCVSGGGLVILVVLTVISKTSKK